VIAQGLKRDPSIVAFSTPEQHGEKREFGGLRERPEAKATSI
jgi:hypothetical protein